MGGFGFGILAQGLALFSILFLGLPPYTSGKRLIGSWVAQELSQRPDRTLAVAELVPQGRLLPGIS